MGSSDPLTSPSEGTQPVYITASKEPPFPPQPKPKPKPAMRPRYYSQALSEEDKHALAVGEENHNLKKWSTADALQFWKSRLEFVRSNVKGSASYIVGCDEKTRKVYQDAIDECEQRIRGIEAEIECSNKVSRFKRILTPSITVSFAD